MDDQLKLLRPIVTKSSEINGPIGGDGLQIRNPPQA